MMGNVIRGFAMQEVDYSSSPYPVRDNLVAEHQTAWRRLAEPGAFLDGARRIAVAREVRHATRDAAFSPWPAV